MPELEDRDVVRRLVGIFPIGRAFVASGTNWYEKRDPEVFVDALDKVAIYRPYVIRYLAKNPNPWVSKIASTGLVSTKDVVAAIVDYAHAFYRRDDDALARNFFSYLGNDFVTSLNQDLTRQQPRDGLNYFDEVLFGAIWWADQLDEYRLMSQQAAAPVAGARLPSGLASRMRLEPGLQQASKAAASFAVLRVALSEEGFFFPRIDGIRHALSLRKNPNIRSFRRRVGELHEVLQKDDPTAILEARKEVVLANKKLNKASSWRRSAKWAAYAAVPVSLLETATIGMPALSLGLSGVSLLSQKASESLFERNRWILVGR